MIEAIVEFIRQNYTWFFSGLGVLILGLLIRYFLRRKSHEREIEYTSEQSVGDFTVRGGGDVSIIVGQTSVQDIRRSIEPYIEELKRSERKMQARIEQLPEELKAIIRNLLSEKPLGTIELAQILGISTKIVDSILRCMCSLGEATEKDGFYYLNSG